MHNAVGPTAEKGNAGRADDYVCYSTCLVHRLMHNLTRQDGEVHAREVRGGVVVVRWW